MNNNRGQSLVLFVFIIPIVLLVIMAIIDIGKMSLLKEELDNINNIAIDYGLDNLSKENLKDEIDVLIQKNKNDIDNVNIEIKEKELKIVLSDSIDLVILKNSNILSVKSSYVGYIKEDKKIIERAK